MSVPKRTSIALSAALACSLALAGPALAAPAGDEYLPKIPNATGHHSNGGNGGTPSSSSSSAASGGTNDVPAGSGSGSSGGGSSGLLIGLLVVAGVIAAAVGMTLRQRAGGADDDVGPDREPGPGSGARPTPDGEIVAGRDKA